MVPEHTEGVVETGKFIVMELPGWTTWQELNIIQVNWTYTTSWPKTAWHCEIQQQVSELLNSSDFT